MGPGAKDRFIKWDAVIALYEMAFGLAGFYATLRALIEARPPDLRGLIQSGLGLLLFLLAFMAGRSLWREHRSGFYLSILLHFLQLASFTFADCGYSFRLGPTLLLAIDAAGRRWRALTYLTGGLSFGPVLEPWGLALNLPAFLASLHLLLIVRRRAYIARVLKGGPPDLMELREMYSSRFRNL